MPTITPLLDQTFAYPDLEHAIAGVTSPAVAVRIKRIAYRAGYLPNYQNDRARFEQIVQVGSDELIADTTEIWIAEGLQLITFPVNDAYTLRLELPNWYQEVEMEIKQIDNLTFAPGSGGQTSQAGLNAILAQLNAAIAAKASQADLETALASLDLSDLVTTAEFIAGLASRAALEHHHDGLYYQKAETFSRDEIQALIGSTPGGGSEPQFSINFPGDTNGLFYWLGTNEGVEPWQNPHNAGRITLSATSFAGSVAAVVDRSNGDTRTENNFFFPWVQVDLLTRQFKPAGYLVRNRVNDGFNMQAWRLQGSHDAATWTTIDFQNNLLPANDWRYIPVSVAVGYRYFRIQQDTSIMSHTYLCLGEWELYGDLV